MEELGGGGAGGAAAAKPGSPAAQLAFPALMATTLTRLPVARRFSLSTMMGAARTRLAVKEAAALAGASATMRAKSAAAALLQPGFDSAKAEAAGDEELGDAVGISVGHGHGSQPI